MIFDVARRSRRTGPGLREQAFNMCGGCRRVESYRLWAPLVLGCALVAACSGHGGGAASPAKDTTQTAVVSAPANAVPTYSVTVVHQYPHDPTAFTEGLEWHDGEMYESTGLVGHSWVRRYDPITGSVAKQVTLAAPHFGEGITVFGGTLYEMTWRDQVGFKYDAQSLAPRGRFTYAGEGWGMTHTAHSLIMSDGTNVLRYLDPATLRITRALTVTSSGQAVPRLNELELIHGEIWANVWQVPEIARIDTATGRVTSWVDLAPLVSQFAQGDTVDVANGIAYDSAGDRIFITGKLWPTLYEIRLGGKE